MSGCGHFLVESDEQGIDLAKRYLSYCPSCWTEQPPTAPPAPTAVDVPGIDEIVPADQIKPHFAGPPHSSGHPAWLE